MGSSLGPAINAVIDALNAGHGINCVGTPDVVTPTKDSIIGRIASTSNKLTLSTKMAKDCFRQQDIMRNVADEMVDNIYEKGIRKTFFKGEKITTQDDAGASVYFILQGKVDVYVAGHLVATRCAKECVGEMSALDPTQRRSATLFAVEDVEVLELGYDLFNEMLEESPRTLKNTAIVLCNRLRERSKFLKTPNKEINIFIGSSKEGQKIADEFKVELSVKLKENGRRVEVNVWHENTFSPSQSNLESLIDEAQKSDFAVFVLTSDDKIVIREDEMMAPRDNVVFELGLFMGCIGRDRTYALILEEHLKEIRIPTDLNGITQLVYSEIEQQNSDNTISKRYDFTRAISTILNKVMDKGVRL